jgi:transposase
MRATACLEQATDMKNLRAVAEKKIIEYEERIRHLENKLLLKEERIAELLRERWGRSSEKLTAGESDKQADLFDEIETAVKEENAELESVPVKSHNRKRGKRARLPAELPRRETVIDIDETEKVCGCGAALVKIGEDASEKLEVIPARFIVRRTVRPRYACPCCGGTENEPERPVAVAPIPPSILPKTNATPSLLATIATWKFQDALPLHRQERIFARHGIELTRATMSRWMLAVADRCKPIVEAIEGNIRSGPMIGMDETPTQVLGEPGRKNTATSYMWLARGGGPGKRAVRFLYRPTRSSSVPKEFLRGYEGVVQTDGLEVYDAALRALKAEGACEIAHVGCMTHVRRMFIKADRSGKVATSAKSALSYIKKLYAVEREAAEAGLDDAGRVNVRREKALPVLTEFKRWLDGRRGEVPPESLIGKAISYTLGQWEKLIRYIDYGFVPIDNNLVENAVRPFVIGRKNYLLHGSSDGADASAALYSIIETAKANGHEPFFYLYYLFSKLPHATDAAAIAALLPFNLERKEVHDFAAANWLGLGS